MKRPATQEYSPVAKTGAGLEHMSRLAASVLDALADDYSRRILASAIPRARTVEQIAAETGAPLSTCYRKLRVLVENGLMVTRRRSKGVRTRELAYRTSIRSATLSLGSEGLGIEVRPNAAAMKRTRAAKRPGKPARPRDSSGHRRVGRGRRGSAPAGYSP